MAKSFILIVFIALAGVFLYVQPEAQADGNTWIDSNDIKFAQVIDAAPKYIKPDTIGGYGNIPCNFQDIVTRPSNHHLIYIFQSEVTERRCAVDIAFGTVAGDLFIRGGSDVGGRLELRSNKEWLLGGANLKRGITYTTSGAPAGSGFLHMSDNLFTNIRTVINTDRSIKNVLVGDGGLKALMNNKGQPLQIVLQTATYSSNADWLLFDSHAYGLVRLNTATGEILSFGSPTSYGGGHSPNYSMAISADGRYAVVSSQNRLDIYDLHNCIDQTGANSHLKKCAVRNLDQVRKSQTNFGQVAANIRFTSDKSIVYRAAELENSAIVNKLFRMTIGDVSEHDFEYLGLGDSFASGEGAFIYKSITDNPENMCHVSLLSYPFLIGEALNKEKYESIACSGAVTEDINYYDNDDYEGQFPDGIKEQDRNENEIVSMFMPGKITQKTFIDTAKPEVVTISIGGNDIGFGDKITNCILNVVDDICFATVEDRAEALIEIAAIIPDLKNTYQKLLENNRRVYVLGYPKIIDPNGNCANNVKLSKSEAEFADSITELLNDAVETAVRQAGVVYVDVENILAGKRLCETESDQTLVNGITQGKDVGPWIFKVLGKESFHPKVGAHWLYKDAVIAQTDNLTKPMPSPDFDAKFNAPPEESAYWDAKVSGRTVYNPVYVPVWDFVDKYNQIFHNLSWEETGLAPNSEVIAEIHSEPVDVGAFMTDAQGNLELNFEMPDSVEPGFHSLHLYGTNITGQPVDIYDYFFIRESADDFDGDGVLDKDEGCILIEPIGTDSDQDGIDNACDGYEDPVPEPEESPQTVTPVPGFGSLSPPKDENFNNPETVAGNEEMAESNTQNEPVQNPVTVASANTAVPVNAPIRLAAADQSGEEEPGEVLSTHDRADQEVAPVTIPESKADEQPPTQAVNNPKVYLYYLIAGAIAFFGLIALIFIARR